MSAPPSSRSTRRCAKGYGSAFRISSGPPAKGIKRKGETKWLKPGLVGRVRHLKGEKQLRHATLQEIKEES